MLGMAVLGNLSLLFYWIPAYARNDEQAAAGR
jgi:hypothetical protein